MADTPWKTNDWFVSEWNYADEVTKDFKFAKNVKIHDITLRDGEQQTGIIMTLDDKIRIAEWVLDYYQDYSRDLCDDCLNLTTSPARGMRGGSYRSGSIQGLLVAYRSYSKDPSTSDGSTGFRCARDLSL